jgi:hypothetical protein
MTNNKSVINYAKCNENRRFGQPAILTKIGYDAKLGASLFFAGDYLAIVVMYLSCASREGYKMADKPLLPIEVARGILASSQRSELVDRAFGDKEVYWCRGNVDVAEGYFGRQASVGFAGTAEYAPTTFRDDLAQSLRGLGTLTKVWRND